MSAASGRQAMDLAATTAKLAAELTEAQHLLDEIAQSPVEFEDARVGYVSVQLDRELWLALRKGRSV